MSQQQNALVSTEHICRCILVLRGEKVILDADLADLYGVETKALVRAMKRNLERFPDDFMFQLSRAEFDFLRCQTGTSSQWGGRRYPPYAFTEHGVAMLSSVLNSPRAIHVNIQIVRTFTKLRKVLAAHEELRHRIETMEQKYDAQFRKVFDVLKAMIADNDPPAKSKTQIGYHTEAKGAKK